MAYSNDTNTGSNNTLYFIVGGLVVLAVIFGLFFYNSTESTLNTTAPASGIESGMETGTGTDAGAAPAGGQDTAPTGTTAPAAP